MKEAVVSDDDVLGRRRRTTAGFARVEGAPDSVARLRGSGSFDDDAEVAAIKVGVDVPEDDAGVETEQVMEAAVEKEGVEAVSLSLSTPASSLSQLLLLPKMAVVTLCRSRLCPSSTSTIRRCSEDDRMEEVNGQLSSNGSDAFRSDSLSSMHESFAPIESSCSLPNPKISLRDTRTRHANPRRRRRWQEEQR